MFYNPNACYHSDEMIYAEDAQLLVLSRVALKEGKDHFSDVIVSILTSRTDY